METFQIFEEEEEEHAICVSLGKYRTHGKKIYSEKIYCPTFSSIRNLDKSFTWEKSNLFKNVHEKINNFLNLKIWHQTLSHQC